jgi:hypothetical protein
MTGGADKSNVPPSVRLPVVVTVPLSAIPETVPVPLTLVTVPPLDGLVFATVSTPFTDLLTEIPVPAVKSVFFQ